MEGAAPQNGLQSNPLANLELLQSELQQAVLHLLGQRDLKTLRRASKSVRDLVNKFVQSITLTEKHLGAAKSLHTRFPLLRKLVVQSDDDSLNDSDFADVALSQLKLLKSLLELDVGECSQLRAATVVAVAFCCSQLESLNLPSSEAINDNALGALSSLKRLRKLNLNSSSVSSGLQHLTQLKQLQQLWLAGCKDVQDADLQHLAGLSSLTALDISNTDISGNTLAALTRLKRLCLESCSKLGAAALAALTQLTQLEALTLHGSMTRLPKVQLAQLTSLVNLRQLHWWEVDLSGPALALLNLPLLEALTVDVISVPNYDPNRGATIKQLTVDSNGMASVLPLPSLVTLVLCLLEEPAEDLMAVMQQPDLQRLVLPHLEEYQLQHLSVMLQGLKKLHSLHVEGYYAPVDEAFLLAVAELQQLEELWLGRLTLPGDSISVLQRCGALRRVTLQQCSGVGRAGLLALLAKRGMQEVVVRGNLDGASAEQLCESLQPLAARWGSSLVYCVEMENPYGFHASDSSMAFG